MPPGHVHDRAPGYLGLHGGIEEIWLPNVRFERVVGGKSQGNELKAELHADRRIATEAWGKKRYYVVKRDSAGLGRVHVVALRLKPRSR